MIYSRVLIVGAGLIGTSIARSRKSLGFGEEIDAVEVSAQNRVEAAKWNVYDHVYENVDQVSKSYDLLILAAPPSVSKSLLRWGLERAQTVTDVCSVKQEICEEAALLGETGKRFIPGHPMAGKATGGTGQADSTLFRDRPWIIIADNAVSVAPFQSWCQEFGANPIILGDAKTHDETMALVSHGIHLTSLSAMLASNKGMPQGVTSLASFAGPAFWDITRLAASPPDFWVDTLLLNRYPVMDYLNHLSSQLQQFSSALEKGDANTIRNLLVEAQKARLRWESDRLDTK